MAVNRVNLNRQLRDALETARPAVAAAKARQRASRATREPFPPEAREAVSTLIADGTYACAVAAVVAQDPELSTS